MIMEALCVSQEVLAFACRCLDCKVHFTDVKCPVLLGEKSVLYDLSLHILMGFF